jgi:hypothetical protein
MDSKNEQNVFDVNKMSFVFSELSFSIMNQDHTDYAVGRIPKSRSCYGPT